MPATALLSPAAAKPLSHLGEADRVRAATSPLVNEILDRRARQRLEGVAARPSDLAGSLIAELDREWDIERVIEAEAAVTALAGLALGTFVDRRLLAMPMFVAGMVFLHAIHGAYPLVPLMRRVGLRTRDEIDRERYAAKAMRGDFDHLAPTDADPARRAAAAWQAVLL